MVHIWMDNSFGDLSKAFNLLHNLKRLLQHNKKEDIRAVLEIIDDNTLSQFRALQGLFLHGYWDRIWVVQEVAVASEALLHSGPRAIKWTDIRVIQNLLRTEF